MFLFLSVLGSVCAALSKSNPVAYKEAPPVDFTSPVQVQDAISKMWMQAAEALIEVQEYNPPDEDSMSKHWKKMPWLNVPEDTFKIANFLMSHVRIGHDILPHSKVDDELSLKKGSSGPAAKRSSVYNFSGRDAERVLLSFLTPLGVQLVAAEEAYPPFGVFDETSKTVWADAFTKFLNTCALGEGEKIRVLKEEEVAQPEKEQSEDEEDPFAFDEVAEEKAPKASGPATDEDSLGAEIDPLLFFFPRFETESWNDGHYFKALGFLLDLAKQGDRLGHSIKRLREKMVGFEAVRPWVYEDLEMEIFPDVERWLEEKGYDGFDIRMMKSEEISKFVRDDGGFSVSYGIMTEKRAKDFMFAFLKLGMVKVEGWKRTQVEIDEDTRKLRNYLVYLYLLDLVFYAVPTVLDTFRRSPCLTLGEWMQSPSFYFSPFPYELDNILTALYGALFSEEGQRQSLSTLPLKNLVEMFDSFFEDPVAMTWGANAEWRSTMTKDVKQRRFHSVLQVWLRNWFKKAALQSLIAQNAP